MRLEALLVASLVSIPAATRPSDTDLATGATTWPSPPPAPTETPPAPPTNPLVPPAKPLIIEVPPGGQVQAAEEQQAPTGQWVYTEQYGWVWIPYGDVYTDVPAAGYGAPYEYVYYPAYGWTWVVAPWVWGIGPWPSFGVYGPSVFGWYGHGWWRSPGRWHYRGPAPLRGGFALHGVSPAPFRGGFMSGVGPATYGSGFAFPGAIRSPFRGSYSTHGGGRSRGGHQ